MIQTRKKVERQQLRVQVKRKATDDLTSRPSKIFRNELHKLWLNLTIITLVLIARYNHSMGIPKNTCKSN